MGHDHGATSLASAAGQHRGRLRWVLLITLVVLLFEVVGAAVTGSLALLADAGHVLTDAAGILVALVAVEFARRPATPQRTFGFFRVEIFAALVNALLLVGIAIFILREAWERWSAPPEVAGGWMLVFAVVGLLANLIAMAILSGGSQESLNLRGAYLEVLGDALGSVAVIVAALLIVGFGWQRADVVASVAVALLILPRTWTLLREAVDVLLEAVPKGMDLAVVRQHLTDVPGVVDVHDLHAWTITSGLPVLSAHVVVTDAALADLHGGRVLDELQACVREHFGVEHATFQLESTGHADHEYLPHA